jgi:hypothetical protein
MCAVVYMERQRQAMRDAAEAAGASLWTDEVDDLARGKLYVLWQDVTSDPQTAEQVRASAMGHIARTTGQLSLTGNVGSALQK